MYRFLLIFVLINYVKGMDTPEYLRFCDFWPKIHQLALSDNNHDALMDLLITHSDEVHRIDFQGNSALHIAAASGSVKIAQALINFEANVRLKNFLGRTPYHQLSLCKNEFKAIEIVNFLSIAGAPINETDNFGYTPLHSAARHIRSILFARLIKFGASLLKQTNFNQNPQQLFDEAFIIKSNTKFSQLLQPERTTLIKLANFNSDQCENTEYQ